MAGAVATLMAVKPLGSVRLLRKVMVWLVLIASVVLFVQVLSQPRQAIPQDAVLGFWPAVDLAVAGVVSFAPLAADYSRHSQTRKAAFWGSSLGYGLAAIAYYTLGVLAVAHLGATDVIGALVALPAGAIALGILLTDEVDEAFANIYSTTMSVQNIAPNVDRRIVAVAIGVIATLLAGFLDFGQYQSFLFLIGSVFVPLFAVAAADFLLVSGQRWDVSPTSRLRWAPVVAWAGGFVAYQLVYPGTVPVWSDFWYAVDAAIGFTPPTWLGSSVAAIVVAAVLMVVLGRLSRAAGRPPPPDRRRCGAVRQAGFRGDELRSGAPDHRGAGARPGTLRPGAAVPAGRSRGGRARCRPGSGAPVDRHLRPLVVRGARLAAAHRGGRHRHRPRLRPQRARARRPVRGAGPGRVARGADGERGPAAHRSGRPAWTRTRSGWPTVGSCPRRWWWTPGAAG